MSNEVSGGPSAGDGAAKMSTEETPFNADAACFDWVSKFRGLVPLGLLPPQFEEFIAAYRHCGRPLNDEEKEQAREVCRREIGLLS